VVDGHLTDQWWSLGLQTDETTHTTTLLSMSGHLSINGQDEAIYNGQNRVSAYLDAWVDAKPHHLYEKHYRLHVDTDVAYRQAWRAPVRRIIAGQSNLNSEQLGWLSRPALEAAVQLKVNYALRRWQENAEACGMDWWPHRPEFAPDRRVFTPIPYYERTIEYGWAGMNLRLGLSLWRWGRRTGNTDLIARGIRIAEKWLRAATQAIAENRPAPTVYVTNENRWCDVQNGNGGFARPTMETIFELALFCRQRRQAGAAAHDWEYQLKELLMWYTDPQRLQSDGTVPLAWTSFGLAQEGNTVTVGVLLAAALAEASQLPEGEHLLRLAQDLMEKYAARFLGSMPLHPYGSALDSGCVDQESGIFLLVAAMSLYEAETVYRLPAQHRLEQAKQAADWVLTWAYTWSVPLMPGTLLHALGFETHGMNDVSVQNRTIHVASPAAELLKLAQLLRSTSDDQAALYHQQALRMLVPQVRTIARPECRWGMDEDGEQPEQFLHTNYIQHPFDPVSVPRGGIARWFVPWMTVWVLSVCLDFLVKAEEPDTV